MLLLLAGVTLGQEFAPDGVDSHDEDPPFGVVGSLLVWVVMILMVFIFCLLIGLGLALGVVILAGLAVMFGAGGVVTSLFGLAATRRPQVGWRIFSVWMHASFMLLAGAAFGGFIAPLLWPEMSSWPAARLGALAGLVTGIAWGWVLALTVERSIGFLQQTIREYGNGSDISRGNPKD
jgi:hypothetical protein